MPYRQPHRQARNPTFIYFPSARQFAAFVLIVAPATVALLSAPPLLAIYLLAVNFLTFLFYQYDKAQSRIAGWRVTEQRLHICEFIGGWPAALIAQRVFQHKTKKTSYQIEFWAIVLLHEAFWINWITGGALKRLLWA